MHDVVEVTRRVDRTREREREKEREKERERQRAVYNTRTFDVEVNFDAVKYLETIDDDRLETSHGGT